MTELADEEGGRTMFCKNCGKEIEEKAVVCTACGCSVLQKKAVYKCWWFWVVIALVVIIIGVAASGDGSSDTGTDNPAGVVQQTIPDEFAGDCPVSLSATVKDNIIGMPELTCHFKNLTDKEIAAIKLYFDPQDVYGKTVDTVFTTHELYTDEAIAANGSCSRSWQMLDQEIKSGKVYLYSVYFADGTEWGNKDASVSQIKKYGIEISANQ